MKYPLMYYVDLCSNALPLTAGAVRWNRIRVNDSAALLVYALVVLAAVVELATFWMAVNHMRNLWVLHVYILIEQVVLMVIFARWIVQVGAPAVELRRPAVSGPAIIRAWTLLFVAFWIASKWSIEPWDQQPTYALTVSTIASILVSIYILYRLVRFRGQTEPPLLKEFRFWVLLGILLYFVGSSFDFLLASVIGRYPGTSVMNVWAVHWGANAIANAAYAAGFLCLVRR